jgi:hypothetical protein
MDLADGFKPCGHVFIRAGRRGLLGYESRNEQGEQREDAEPQASKS